MKWTKLVALGLLAVTSVGGWASAAEFDDGLVAQMRANLKGKRVGFVPISMGFNQPQVWYEGLKRDAERYGYEIIVRDPNWNVQAGAQAFTQLIGEKVDMVVVQPLEMQAYAKLVDRAAAAGITVVQVNTKSMNTGDAYVGANYYEVFVKQAEFMVDRCGKDAGGNGKVALIQGVLTTSTSQIGLQAVQDVFAQHPDIQVVANQAADWDATKAKSVTSTILKQHPDLCGIVGFWDVMDIGTAAAIKEAGLQDKVTLVTSGGGEDKAVCENVKNGSFTADVTYDASSQARDLVTTVSHLLQNKPKELGKQPIGIYTDPKVITKDNADAGLCWNLENIKKYGP